MDHFWTTWPKMMKMIHPARLGRAPLRSARLGSRRSSDHGSARVCSTPLRFTPPRSALLRSRQSSDRGSARLGRAPLCSAPLRSTRLAALRPWLCSAPLRSAPLHFAPLGSARGEAPTSAQILSVRLGSAALGPALPCVARGPAPLELIFRDRLCVVLDPFRVHCGIPSGLFCYISSDQ